MSDYNEFLSLWKTRRLSEICRVLYLFSNYLLIPREGYKKYDVVYISGDITKYVIEEIFGCSIKVNHKLYTEDFKRVIHEDLMDCFIENEVYDHLWNYMSNLENSLTLGIKPEDIINNLKVKYDEEKIFIIINMIYKLEKTFETELSKLKTDEYKKRKFKLISLSNEERFVLTKMGIYSSDLVDLESYRILQTRVLNETEKTSDWNSYKKFLDKLLPKVLTTLEKIYEVFIGSELYSLSYPPIKEPIKRLKDNNKLDNFINLLIDEDIDISVKANQLSYELLKKRVEESVNYISQLPTKQNIEQDEFNTSYINAMIYLLITISDWLEKSVEEEEIKLAISIILPTKYKINIDQTISEDDDKINDYLSQQLEINGVGYNKNHFYLISETLKSINKNDDIRKEINNRIRFFSDNLKKLY